MAKPGEKKKKKKEQPNVREGIPDGRVGPVSMDRIELWDNAFEFRVSPRVDDLVEDIARNGQQFPIIVRASRKTENFQVVSGYRRVRALKQLGWPDVVAIIREDLSDNAAYRLSFLENERRKSLTGVDKAHAIAKLRLLGKSTEQIKALYGLGDKQLQRYEKVGGFPDVLKEAISKGRFPTSHGLVLAQASEQHGDKLNLKDWIWRVREDDLTVRQLRRALNGEFGKPKKRVRYIERKGGAFRLYPMHFDPKTTDDGTRAKMLETLKAAVQLLESNPGPNAADGA